MSINTNKWNKIRYTLYTPGYNLIARIFKNSRKKSIDSLEIKNGDKILIIGAGTGLDLEFIPSNCEIVATDITPSMIEKLKKENSKFNHNLSALVMDGQSLDFPDNSFDIVILHLILAVIPDPIKCFKETERVVKSGGQITIFDKFVSKDKKISSIRHMLNGITNLLFSDITRDFESIQASTQLQLISDEKADFNGNFRLIRLIKS